MNFKNMKTWLIAMTFACTMGSLSHLSAVTNLTINDQYYLGLIDPNQPASGEATEIFVDTLLDRPLNSGPTNIATLVGNQTFTNAYTRSGNQFLSGIYPDADFAVDLGEETNIDLGSGYLYLVGKYDGPNYGAAVWYVGDLDGLVGVDVTIPSTAGGYGLSHTYLFNGVTPPPNGVPDGGTTLMLLGSALAGLGALRRRFA